jgi:hypothetical protein
VTARDENAVRLPPGFAREFPGAEAHVRHILTKLDISEGQDGHRRVLAVMACLNEVNNSVDPRR